MPKLYWYQKANRKHATGFLRPSDLEKLKRIAKAHDATLARYITQLLESHIRTHCKDQKA